MEIHHQNLSLTYPQIQGFEEISDLECMTEMITILYNYPLIKIN